MATGIDTLGSIIGNLNSNHIQGKEWKTSADLVT